jgi:hypothetical protein
MELEKFENETGLRFKYRHLLGNGAIIAGGAVRDFIDNNKTPKDIDVFFICNKNDPGSRMSLYIREIIRPLSGKLTAFTTITYEVTDLPPIQLIVRDNPNQKSVCDLLESFDFTVAQCAIWTDDDGNIMITMFNTTQYDIKHKYLVYNLLNLDGIFPMNSLVRYPRFLGYGYTIERKELYKIAQHVVATNGKSGNEAYDSEDE